MDVLFWSQDCPVAGASYNNYPTNIVDVKVYMCFCILLDQAKTAERVCTKSTHTQLAGSLAGLTQHYLTLTQLVSSSTHDRESNTIQSMRSSLNLKPRGTLPTPYGVTDPNWACKETDRSLTTRIANWNSRTVQSRYIHGYLTEQRRKHWEKLSYCQFESVTVYST